jgi:metal-responsive CopG/Arc/MetJ family transcriptional regulator
MNKEVDRFSIYGPWSWLDKLETVRMILGENNRSRFIRDLIVRGLADLIKEKQNG